MFPGSILQTVSHNHKNTKLVLILLISSKFIHRLSDRIMQSSHTSRLQDITRSGGDISKTKNLTENGIKLAQRPFFPRSGCVSPLGEEIINSFLRDDLARIHAPAVISEQQSYNLLTHINSPF